MRGERILRVLKICNTACLVKLFGFCLTKACEEQLRLKSILDQAYKAYSKRLTIFKGSRGGPTLCKNLCFPTTDIMLCTAKTITIEVGAQTLLSIRVSQNIQAMHEKVNYSKINRTNIKFLTSQQTYLDTTIEDK